MQVGDVVYIVEHFGGVKPRLYKSKIEKIGRKYFYASGLKFDIKTNYYVEKDYSQFNATCYFSPQEYYEKILPSVLHKKYG